MAGFARYMTYPECSHAVAGKATGTSSLTGTCSRILSPTLRYNVKTVEGPRVGSKDTGPQCTRMDSG